MNASPIANAWQDGHVTTNDDGSRPAPPAGGPDAPPAEVPRVRQVTEVEALKALADPIRLRILRAMMTADLPVLSVKELAALLGEPQTKLYRHVKLLESVGLIRVVATRLVSGIMEQRYQASQHDVVFRGPGRFDEDAGTPEAEAVVAGVLDSYREEFFTAMRTGQLPDGDYGPDEAYRKPVMQLTEGRVSRERAAAARLKLAEVIEELGSADDPDGVPVNVLIGFYSPAAQDR